LYPAEVEEVLAAHPAVARVAVVGTPDDVLGEIGVAVVVAAPGQEPVLAALREHCAGELSDYKSPDALVVVDELPLTPMMKVDPARLGELAARAAEERRSARAQRRGRAAGMVGSGDTGGADAAQEKERA
jgi:acyl-CoA synthetase (AMP-forming)/AMP-acid ligase II